jgi:hypothetical protein
MGHMGNGEDVMGNGEDVIMGDESLIYGYVKSSRRRSRLTASPTDPMDHLGARGLYLLGMLMCTLWKESGRARAPSLPPLKDRGLGHGPSLPSDGNLSLTSAQRMHTGPASALAATSTPGCRLGIWLVN